MIILFDQIIHKISTIIKSNIWFLYDQVSTIYNQIDDFCEIDLLITLVDKDIEVCKKSIESVKIYSLNSIKNIYIISPDTIKIRQLCDEYNCIFVDEDTISPFSSSQLIDKGVDIKRIGWIKQQLIKLNSDSLVSIGSKYLIMDADTILLKKQFFTKNGVDILKFSDEFHFLYKISSKIILGDLFYSFKSFISHHQLINKNILIEMKLHISKIHKKEWFEVFVETAIKNNNYVSEYELYAQYCILNKKSKVKQQYWFNINNILINIKNSNVSYHKAQSISYHNYL